MQIISNKQVLFELTKYIPEEIDGKETGRSVAHVEKKILVVADSVRPQVVPDWVKDDPHYEMLVEDGQIMEVTGKKPGKPKAALKAANAEAETPKAAFADEAEGAKKEEKPAEETGWGKG